MAIVRFQPLADSSHGGIVERHVQCAHSPMHLVMPPLLIGGSIKRLTSVCLSRTSGLSREQRDNTKTGTEVAHVTHDSDTTFKVKRSRSPGRFTHQGSCGGERGNVLGVGNLLLRCGVLGGASAPTEGGERRGHIVAAARLQVVESAAPSGSSRQSIVIRKHWATEMSLRVTRHNAAV